jgi:predicted 3-demethylubiquinone-9 3-methyltransferase (glyoxalase superfamily)
MNESVSIFPCLWFDRDAEAAVAHYCQVFPRSRRLGVMHYAGDGHLPAGTVLTLEFELAGQRFLAMNGGIAMPPSSAVSLVVECDSQAELDRLFDQLSADPAREQCGWLVDRWGFSWQITPRRLLALMNSGTAAQRRRLFDRLLSMKRLDIAELEAAHAAAA